MERERGVRVVGVSDPDVVDCLGVVELLQVGVVRQPAGVPVVDAVKVGRVVQPVVACMEKKRSYSIKAVVRPLKILILSLPPALVQAASVAVVITAAALVAAVAQHAVLRLFSSWPSKSTYRLFAVPESIIEFLLFRCAKELSVLRANEAHSVSFLCFSALLRKNSFSFARLEAIDDGNDGAVKPVKNHFGSFPFFPTLLWGKYPFPALHYWFSL